MNGTIEPDGTLLSDLKAKIASRDAVLLLGTGISVAATKNAPAASWKGLLECGVNRCVDLNLIEGPQGENLKRLLDSNDSDLWIAAAQTIETKLRNRSGEYALWLRDFVGSLKVEDVSIVTVLGSLGIPLFTTNYDNILEDITHLPTVTWRQPADLERVVHGELRAIAHLHGHFGDPESIVLGTASYEEAKGDEFLQTMMRALRSTKTLVFIGFGKGLQDPNFGAFLKWSREAFKNSPYRHFRLARESECAELQASHDPDERIFVLPYGARHDDLLPFLESLVPEKLGKPPEISPKKAVADAPRIAQSLDQYHAEIDLAKQYTKKGEPEVALALLEKLRIRHSSDFNNRIWYRLLANVAHAHEEREEFDKAAILYLQAKDYEPQNVDAQCFEAIAYFLQGNAQKAYASAQVIRTEHSQSSLAQAVWIRSSPETIPFSELESSTPEHYRASEDVAHALMFAASSRNHFDDAERYARICLAIEPDSPMIFEQLGAILLDHARHQLRDIEADIPPATARKYAEEAATTLTRALAMREQRGAPGRRARILMNLGMANEILGNSKEADRCLILAFDADPDSPEIIYRYALHLATKKEFSTAIALVKKLRTDDNRDRAALLLGNLYLSSAGDTDHQEGESVLASLLPKLESLEPQARFECLRRLLIYYGEAKNSEKGEHLLGRLDQWHLSALAVSLLRLLYYVAGGNVAEAKTIALAALQSTTTSDNIVHRRLLARELTILKCYSEVVPLWKQLVEPTYIGMDIHMALVSATRSDDVAYVIAMGSQLRKNGFYDEDCIVAELEVLNRFNCIEEVGILLEETLRVVDNDVFKQNLRVNQSLLGLELNRPSWVTTDPSLLPHAKVAHPHIGRAVVQILSSSPTPLGAVEYAYELLRRNFASKDANMAMIGAVLIGERHSLNIPQVDTVVPGAAVAYRESSSSETRWWIIEDSDKPERARRELPATHLLAQRLLGKKVDESVTIRDATLQARFGQILEVKSKYVYRFQQCLQEFEEYFPGESFLMQFSATDPKTEEPDFQPLLRSIEQKVEWTKQIERNYRRMLPSMNFFAQSSQTHVFDSSSHLASERLAIRCCQESSDELSKALANIAKATTVVIDGSALATLFLSKSFRCLNDIPLQPVVSYGTYRALRQLYMERLNSGGQGFLGKVGDRFVFQKDDPEARNRYLENMAEFVGIIESKCKIVGGQDFAKISKQERDKVEHLFGRPCGESIALAMNDESVLWLDDLPVAQLSASTYRVKYAWTQAVICHGCESGWFSEDLLVTVSLELLQLGYTATQLVPKIVCDAGRRADWSLEDRHFRTALSWFGNGDVPPKRLAWVASNVVAIAMSEPSESIQGDKVILALLREVGGRHDGQTLLKQFCDSLDTGWKLVPVDIERLRGLIKQMIT